MVRVTKTKLINITPDHPMYIGGHAMRTGKFQGVYDEIEVTVLGLEVDGEKLLMVEADLSNFDTEFARLFRYHCAEYFGLKYNHVILSAGHSHSAPLFKTRNEDMPAEESYRQMVLEKMIAGSAETINGEFYDVAKVEFTTGQSEGFYGNRNSKDKYGDTNIYVLKFLDGSNQTISAIVNLSCHSTVLSPEDYFLSGDLLAALRRKLTPYLGVTPLVCNGNAGDISTRLYRQNNDYNELMRVSSGIAEQISQFTDTVELSLSKPESRAFTYIVDYDPDIPSLKQRLQKSEEQLETATVYDVRKWLISEISGFKRKIKAGHVHLELDTTIIRMGDLEIVVLPCELVSAFGRQVKKSSMAKACFIWGYANGQNGYVVEASEFGGGHDGISTQMPKGRAEEYVARIIQNLFDN